MGNSDSFADRDTPNRQARPRQASARARLRQRAQLTLPEEIRRALRVSEGDEVEFSVLADGTITVRGYASVPTDQLWLYRPHRDGGHGGRGGHDGHPGDDAGQERDS